MDTVTQRVRDNRTLTSPHVTYSEAAGHAWLAGRDDVDDPDSQSIAEAFACGFAYGNSADVNLDAVLTLVSYAIDGGPITVNSEIKAGYELTSDIADGVLEGGRLLVTTAQQLTLAGEPVWASDLVNDEFGMHGAMNALWNTAWAIHDLMQKVAAERNGLLIASCTNPWIHVDGQPYDWQAKPLPAATNDCEQCAESPVPGAIPAMDTPAGIQRCDQCELFPGDLEAAAALAVLVGGRVRFQAML